MHAGFSFSYSSISVLLRQPLSIKKSYAGAIQLRFHNAGKPADSCFLLEAWKAGTQIKRTVPVLLPILRYGKERKHLKIFFV
jgi:hypothetical protein